MHLTAFGVTVSGLGMVAAAMLAEAMTMEVGPGVAMIGATFITTTGGIIVLILQNKAASKKQEAAAAEAKLAREKASEDAAEDAAEARIAREKLAETTKGIEHTVSNGARELANEARQMRELNADLQKRLAASEAKEHTAPAVAPVADPGVDNVHVAGDVTVAGEIKEGKKP